jgi:hypothetical protein
MAEQAAEPRVSVARGSTSTGWAVGFVVFAGVMMVMLGVFHALEGLTAIFKDQFFVATPNYLYSVDVTTWGWIHLIGGIVVALAGFYVFSGALWARIIGIVLAGLSAIANFLFIPHYPIWSLLMIALCVLVIWALAVHGREIAA